MSYLYEVYGRTIGSDARLFGVTYGAGRPDVRLEIREDARFRASPRWYHTVRMPNGTVFLAFARQAESFRVRCHGLDFFLSPDGKSIITSRIRRDLGSVFLDNVFPLALSLDGAVLHASGVSSRGGTLAFLGASGAGKSTLAEAFTSHGCKIQSDDALALEFRRGAIFSSPGPNHLRLFRGGEHKARVRHIAGRRSPLRAIFLLERRGDEIRIEDVAPIDRWRALLANSFRLALDEPRHMETELRRLHDVIERVPVRRLIYPSRERSLPKVVERVRREYNTF